MTAVIVAAGIANHLRGKREFSRMSDIASAHKTGLDFLLTHFMPGGKQYGHVWLDELNSTPYELIFNVGYNLMNTDREIVDSVSLRVIARPTFGGWIDIEIPGSSLPAGTFDRTRVRDAFHIALCTPVEWNGSLHNYKRIQ
jgi:hypothetical protein